MHRDSRFFTGQGSSNYGYGYDGYANNADADGHYGHETPNVPCSDRNLAGASNGYRGVEFQPSENCPNNYLFFDHDNNNSRIMFNPSYAEKLNYAAQVHVPRKIHDKDDQYLSSSSFKEDSEEIDALLSLDNEDKDEEDDVLSTGRTPSNHKCSSPDSACSAGASRSGKQRCSYADDCSRSERKRERVKKMVKALRGIVPGGQQMDTPAFLDEAVRYLKSLKMEVKKLGYKN